MQSNYQDLMKDTRSNTPNPYHDRLLFVIYLEIDHL